MDKLFGIVDDENFKRVCIDSRSLQSGDCFFAIKGNNFDARSFVEDAFRKGASRAVVQKGCDFERFGERVIEVDDTSRAMGELAAYYRSKLSAKVVGITGSVGKTGTRDIISQILSSKFKCKAAEKSHNNHIGLPLTILQTPRDCEVLVLELGTNHPGEIEYLAKIARPDIAVITKVAASHLEFFGSIENIAAEKASISKGLNAGGELIVNTASKELIDFLEKEKIPYTGYNIHGKGETCGESGTLTIDNFKINVPLAGMGSLENSLAAYMVCKNLGFSGERFKDAIAKIEPSDMRLNIINANGLKIINDCYNASPQSMQNAIEVLCDKSNSGRKVLICGDMKELGEKSLFYHEQIGKLAAQSGASLIAAVGEYAQAITAAAKKENPKIQTHQYKNTQALCTELNTLIKTGDTILIKASRSIGLEKCTEKLIRQEDSQSRS